MAGIETRTEYDDGMKYLKVFQKDVLSVVGNKLYELIC